MSLTQYPPPSPSLLGGTQILKFSLTGGERKLALHEVGRRVLQGTYFLGGGKKNLVCLPKRQLIFIIYLILLSIIDCYQNFITLTVYYNNYCWY